MIGNSISVQGPTIHYNYQDGKHLFILGEAKTYTADYRFAAFEDAIKSMLKTFLSHRKEMGSYVYDDFIDDKLQHIAQAYKDNTISGVEVHLVCVITYNETQLLEKTGDAAINEQIMKIIEERGAALKREIFEPIVTVSHLQNIVFDVSGLELTVDLR